MTRLLWLIVILCLSACANQQLSSNKIFSNAQVRYQAKERTALSKRSHMEMPSYFFELEYESGQIALNKAQINKIDSVFKKLIYSDEYKLYVSFGTGNSGNKLKSLSPIIKRAEDIKRRYSKQVREVHIVYLKNQKLDCAYFRLLG